MSSDEDNKINIRSFSRTDRREIRELKKQLKDATELLSDTSEQLRLTADQYDRLITQNNDLTGKFNVLVNEYNELGRLVYKTPQTNGNIPVSSVITSNPADELDNENNMTLVEDNACNKVEKSNSSNKSNQWPPLSIKDQQNCQTRTFVSSVLPPLKLKTPMTNKVNPSTKTKKANKQKRSEFTSTSLNPFALLKDKDISVEPPNNATLPIKVIKPPH